MKILGVCFLPLDKRAYTKYAEADFKVTCDQALDIEVFTYSYKQ